MVPPQPSAFQRKSTPYVSNSFTLQLAMGGQRAGRLASKLPTPIGRLESMCPLQGQGVVTAQPSESEGQVPTSWAPMGGGGQRTLGTPPTGPIMGGYVKPPAVSSRQMES